MSDTKESGYQKLKQSISKNKKFLAILGIAAVGGGLGYKYCYLPMKDKDNGKGGSNGNPNGGRDDPGEPRSGPKMEPVSSSRTSRGDTTKGGGSKSP